MRNSPAEKIRDFDRANDSNRMEKGRNMSVKCLMLETSDKKRFFTNLGSRKHLAEYCRAFGAKTLVVRAELKRSQLMTIPGIVSALCDRGREANKVGYEEVEKEKKVRRSARSSRR